MLKGQDVLKFVQFFHPKDEHPLAIGEQWNTGKHQRKFLLSPGRLLRNVKGKPLESPVLTFWGEWEPPAIAERISSPIEKGPRYLFSPYYILPRNYDRLTNTDPFVFGDRFLYGCCQQGRKDQRESQKRPTAMASLGKGSVILFGSHLGGEFVLDTVFVVKDYKDYRHNRAAKELEGIVPPIYVDTVLKTFTPKAGCSPVSPNCSWDQCPPPETLRLYRGATFDDPENGMYSFVPAIPRTEAQNGFARPVISPEGALGNRISRGQTQGVRHDAPATKSDIVACWKEVVRQIIAQGLCLGFDFSEPTKRK